MSHLRVAPSLGRHEVTAGHLTRDHRGRVVAVRGDGAVLIGALLMVSESRTTGWPILEVSAPGAPVRLHVRHDHPVTILPVDADYSVTLQLKPEATYE